MPRPKGSKNKTKIAVQSVAQIEAEVEKSNATLQRLAARQEEILQEIEEKKAELKDVKKQVTAERRTLDKLQKKHEEALAAEKAKAQKSEIEAIIAKLVSSGKSADDIMAALNNV